LDNEEWVLGGFPLARAHTETFGQQYGPSWDLFRIAFMLRSCAIEKKGMEAHVC